MKRFLDDLKILYEDNHLLVVEKFANVLSQKDQTDDISMNDIIKEYIKVKYNKPGNVYVGLIHRLDRRVGGVMVFAKTSKAAARLSEDIRLHNFDKYYLAFCKGGLTEGVYKDYLQKDENKKLAFVSKSGKEAILEYKLINSIIYNNELHSYVRIKLLTGRYNQIRCQFSSRNHPLVNDYKYGYNSSNGNIGLWCYGVTLTHPITKEKLHFESWPKGNIWSGLEREER